MGQGVYEGRSVMAKTKEEIAAYQKAYREANKERIAAKNKAHYEANKEKIAERHKSYREANKEKIVDYFKAYREANKEKIVAYYEAHYEANKERISAKNKAYYEANKEKKAAYYEANKEKIAAYRKAHNEANKEKISAKKRAYREANREKIASLKARHRALKRKQIPVHLRDCPHEKKRLVEIYKLRNIISEATGVQHHVDHMWPLADGGPHWSGNLQVIPAKENLSKSASVCEETRSTILKSLDTFESERSI